MRFVPTHSMNLAGLETGHYSRLPHGLMGITLLMKLLRKIACCVSHDEKISNSAPMLFALAAEGSQSSGEMPLPWVFG